MSSIRDPRSSEGYKSRFELWGNVFLHQAFANVINSLASLEVTTQSAGGVMLSEVRIPLDRFIWNVKILKAMILDEWAKKDDHVNFEELTNGIDIESQPAEYFHAIVELLSRRKMLRFKQQRTLGGPPAEG